MLKGGVSMDQVLAAHLGEETAAASLVLGCEQPITGYHETNFSMAYSSHISWQDALSPVPMEVYPSLAFDSLFDNQGSRRNQSILDRVKEQAAELNTQVSRADQAKLDEYLTSVREVEKRVERTRAMKDRADERATSRGRPAATMPRPDNGLPEDIREHMRLMCDIIALAFQTDKTRVATLLLCRDLSGLFYPFLDVRTAHHPSSHDDQSDAYERVSRYYVSQLAYLAGRLDAHEGGRANGARQLVPDVHLQHVVGQPARFDQGAAPARRRAGRHTRNRPRARLHRQERRQPQALQPVPLAHGSHGREAETVWRRRRASGRAGGVTMRFSRITMDPAVMGGKACIRGLRVTVSTVVGLLAAGRTPAEILAAYPYLEAEDIEQALAYAAWRLEEREADLAVK